uniref:Uncharacterized protein n=1 Tax=Meloidogyne hapla TaxID=6305 RepID=A0A1I8BI52_MELHA
MKGMKKGQEFTVDENYINIKTSTLNYYAISVLIITSFVGIDGFYATFDVVLTASHQKDHDQKRQKNVEIVDEAEANFPDCSWLFIKIHHESAKTSVISSPPYPLPSCTCSATSKSEQIEYQEPLSGHEERLNMAKNFTTSSTSQHCPIENQQVSSTIGQRQQKPVNVPVTTRAVPYQPRPLPSSAISPYSLSQSFSLQPLLQGPESLFENSAVKTGHNRSHQNIVGTSSSYTTSSSVKCSLEGAASTNVKLLSPLVEQRGNGSPLLAAEEGQEEQQDIINDGRQKREEICRNAKTLSVGVSLPSATENAEPEAIVIPVNSSQQGEDCPFCRSLDCEIM